MNIEGLALCARYAYPPNSLSLCGPEKQTDLRWYSTAQKADLGTVEILSQFKTLFPYLKLIASANKLKDFFSPTVVEAYWLGNNLLQNIHYSDFIIHLEEGLNLRKQITKKDLNTLKHKTVDQILPHHASHVLNIYKRTGHNSDLHTIESMDACIINWGKVKKVLALSLLIETRPLILSEKGLAFGKSIDRKIIPQGKNDLIFKNIIPGDIVSYHWGYLCQKLSKEKMKNLIYYTLRGVQSSSLTL